MVLGYIIDNYHALIMLTAIIAVIDRPDINLAVDSNKRANSILDSMEKSILYLDKFLACILKLNEHRS